MLNRTNRTLSAIITRPNLRTRTIAPVANAFNVVNDTLRTAFAHPHQPQGECMSPRIGSYLGKPGPLFQGKRLPILPGSSWSQVVPSHVDGRMATRSRWLFEAPPTWRPMFDIEPTRTDRSEDRLPTPSTSTDSWTTRAALRPAALGG